MAWIFARVESEAPFGHASGMRFLSPFEIHELMDEAYACRLLDALEPGVAIRSHDGVSLRFI